MKTSLVYFLWSKHVDQTYCVFWPSSMTCSFTTVLFPHCFPFQGFGPVRPLEASGRSGLDPILRVVRVCVSVTIQGRLSHLLRFQKSSCELLAPFWNKHCLLKLPSSSEASSFCTSCTDDIHACGQNYWDFKATRYCVFLCLEGMLLFPSTVLLEWTGTHLTCFGWGPTRSSQHCAWVYLLLQC